MKRILTPLLIACLLLFSCSSATPEKYFTRAALSCNMLYGFAGYELQRDLAQQQEKLADANTMKMKAVTRAEVVKEKLARVEESYKKIKSLGSNADAGEMLKASAALYEFVIPVYKNEYIQLAALYDDGAVPDKINSLEKSINEKYEAKFLELYNAVWTAGKAYASKHGIPLKEVNPSP